MITLSGKNSTAIVYTNNLEESAKSQIIKFLDLEIAKDSIVRIMPDVHSGVGCVIGFCADIKDVVIPSLVGVDIGCGMLTVTLGKDDIDYIKLDKVISEYVPSGQNVHANKDITYEELNTLRCYKFLKGLGRLHQSLGTLGGGNHFIEIDVDDEGTKYLVIHTGSRNLGQQVATYYQNKAYESCLGREEMDLKRKKIIEENQNDKTNRKNIPTLLKKLKTEYDSRQIDIDFNLCHLKGSDCSDYLHDMDITQRFATDNRMEIASIILKKMFKTKLSNYEYFETKHNYISDGIVRKGAISANKDEIILIPINMRDGSLLCKGRGNSDWLNSAPHGAGRIYSRKMAKELFTVNEFKKQMSGIYTTSINADTLDECPMVYKDMGEIVEHISDTCEILKVLRPLYNFKAGN